MQIICIARVYPLRYPNARKFLAIFIVDKPKNSAVAGLKFKKAILTKKCDGHATVFQVNPSFHIKES